MCMCSAVEKSLCIAQNVNHAHPEIHFYKAGDAQAGGTIGIVYSQAKQAKAMSDKHTRTRMHGKASAWYLKTRSSM